MPQSAGTDRAFDARSESRESSPNDTGMALVRGLARLPDYWDLVLVDTPPTVGYLSLAPLVASDHVVIAVEAHALAFPGVASAAASMERAREQVSPRVDLLGIVACRVNSTIHARDVLAHLRSTYGSAVLRHTVRETIRLAEAPTLQLPITRYVSQSNAAADCRAVADELLDPGRAGEPEPHRGFPRGHRRRPRQPGPGPLGTGERVQADSSSIPRLADPAEYLASQRINL